MKPAIAIALILSASVAYAGWRDLPMSGNIEDRRSERGFTLTHGPVKAGITGAVSGPVTRLPQRTIPAR
jgi:hypothetical protein